MITFHIKKASQYIYKFFPDLLFQLEIKLPQTKFQVHLSSQLIYNRSKFSVKKTYRSLFIIIFIIINKTVVMQWIRKIQINYLLFLIQVEKNN